MPLNKKSLFDRLDLMFWLPENWDGFGTPPICKTVYNLTHEMIEYIEVDVDMNIYVGVEPEGSLFSDIRRPQDKICRVELRVLPDGKIEYEEIRNSKVLNAGAFILSYETINDILR